MFQNEIAQCPIQFAGLTLEEFMAAFVNQRKSVFRIQLASKA